MLSQKYSLRQMPMIFLGKGGDNVNIPEKIPEMHIDMVV
jgi:hypothetical protein